MADSWLPAASQPVTDAPTFALSVDILLSAVVDASWMEVVEDNRGPNIAAAE